MCTTSSNIWEKQSIPWDTIQFQPCLTHTSSPLGEQYQCGTRCRQKQFLHHLLSLPVYSSTSSVAAPTHCHPSLSVVRCGNFTCTCTTALYLLHLSPWIRLPPCLELWNQEPRIKVKFKICTQSMTKYNRLNWWQKTIDSWYHKTLPCYCFIYMMIIRRVYHIVTNDDFHHFHNDLLRGSKYQYLQCCVVSKRRNI